MVHWTLEAFVDSRLQYHWSQDRDKRAECGITVRERGQWID